jgi:hypothetical protein
VVFLGDRQVSSEDSTPYLIEQRVLLQILETPRIQIICIDSATFHSQWYGKRPDSRKDIPCRLRKRHSQKHWNAAKLTYDTPSINLPDKSIVLSLKPTVPVDLESIWRRKPSYHHLKDDHLGPWRSRT